MKKIFKYFIPLCCMAFLLNANNTSAAINDCKPGYIFKANTGVGCVQENCSSIPDAHYSYTGYCICGSSGSINENLDDPNKECTYTNDHESCPGCLYACVNIDAQCPNETANNTNNSTVSSPANNAPSIQPTTPPTQPITSSANPTSPSSASTPSLSTTASTSTPTITTPPTNKKTCQQFCSRLMRGGQYDEVLEFSGEYPNCKCVIDNRDNNNRLIETIKINGDTKTVFTFDPKTDRMIGKNTLSIAAERQRILDRLGVKYDEDQIDALLEDQRINDWFNNRMQNINTNTDITHPDFWWQHFVALMDHGFGNSIDFVDVNNFGRCGDSMMWLEQNLAAELKLDGEVGSRSEAMLSITGEKYNNMLNHTALMIRPQGFSNIEWTDLVNDFITKTQNGGLTANDIQNLDPRLLDAKVLDPYFKKTTTVRDFIKGWSVVKIS